MHLRGDYRPKYQLSMIDCHVNKPAYIFSELAVCTVLLRTRGRGQVCHLGRPDNIGRGH